MNIEELLNQMSKESGSNPIPMELLSKINEDAVFEHAANKKWLYSKDAIPTKYKLLMSISVAAALGQENCIKTYVNVALRQGMSKEEISEALLVARFIKATTVISASAPAMELMANYKVE